ncbi:MAG TPA: DUF308 domain-containing protein [Candidatus Eisenbacteria bacterium]|jgi:uncharacterized membrane protein HdeD (DUF308 family)|nr:DUF308 domain-containing protein [Candidatus Eisenbacteria bacterium]
MATPVAPNHGWVLLLLWGMAWIILGFFLLFQPGLTAILLVQIMAVFWVVGGVIDLMNGLTHHDQPHRGWRIFSALLGIAAGVVIMIHPIVGTLVTIAFGYYLLAFTAIVTGLINLVGVFKKHLSWGGSLLGLMQVILGIFLVTHPMVGMLAYVPTLGIVVIAAGIVIIISSFKVKRTLEAAPAA